MSVAQVRDVDMPCYVSAFSLVSMEVAVSVIFEHSEFGDRIVDHRDADRLLAQAKAVCEPMLRESVRMLPPPFRVMAGYHLGFSDVDGAELAGCSGKGLRSGLVLATAQACGGRTAEAAAAVVAAATATVHNFTLVHDDVIDGDRTRRGRATVWSRWGGGPRRCWIVNRRMREPV